jgi:4-hydroxy-tetrahydrodipicolinate synthase
MNLNFIESNPIPVKAAMAMMELLDDSYRLPLTPISTSARSPLEQELRKLHLIR